MEKLSPEGRAYYPEAVSAGSISHPLEQRVLTVVTACHQMGKAVPLANDEMIGIKDAERSTYWCNLAMVRKDYQGQGIAKAMFQLAFKEVRLPRCGTLVHSLIAHLRLRKPALLLR